MSSGTLNPDNILNQLSPADAFHFEVARNLYLAVLGASVWDILVYIPDDIRILRMRKRVTAVKFCFITSRVLALCHILLTVMNKTIPVDDCELLAIVSTCCCFFSLLSSFFLFLRRVQAVYAESRWVPLCFSILWLVSGGIGVLVPLGIHSTHIQGTKYCIDLGPHRYMMVGGIIPFVFDTSVFLAISYKIATSYAEIHDERVSWSTLVSGRALPRLSRAVLQGGQQYYLLTTGFYITLIFLLGIPSVPPIYENLFAPATISLTASMACRVYRNIVLLDLSARTLQLPISDLSITQENHVHKHPENTLSSLPAPTGSQTQLTTIIIPPSLNAHTTAQMVNTKESTES